MAGRVRAQALTANKNQMFVASACTVSVKATTSPRPLAITTSTATVWPSILGSPTRIFNEEQDKLPAWQRTDTFQVYCHSLFPLTSHSFHGHCLAKHLRISHRIFNEEQDKLPAWQRTDTFQATCPVCRAEVVYDVESLGTAPPPLDLLQADNFTPSAELRRLQQQMAALYLRQKQRGGIIQQDSAVLLLTEDGGSAADNR
ncbi:uncharacterized protein LOC124368104 [Homalodisca vitripennis]|uniref:uncharacterized protein LOC124368104 n=1 Tax=Homalodisca vitripennis TaxID=197043 RepID=UPI001EE9D6CB|nr:uncharacterized protein LOC124368104 [Homalodisca vitripennis]